MQFAPLWRWRVQHLGADSIVTPVTRA